MNEINSEITNTRPVFFLCKTGISNRRNVEGITNPILHAHIHAHTHAYRRGSERQRKYFYYARNCFSTSTKTNKMNIKKYRSISNSPLCAVSEGPIIIIHGVCCVFYMRNGKKWLSPRHHRHQQQRQQIPNRRKAATGNAIQRQRRNRRIYSYF